MSDPIRDHVPRPAPNSNANLASPSHGIEIDCYEGPGGGGPGKIELSIEALKRHVFVAGATGSGKTTLLRAIIRQTIAIQAADPTQKAGLLILDMKGDDTAAFVHAAAAAVGREKDVVVLSLESSTGFDFFADCRTLADVSEYTQRLTFGCGRVETHDNFWDQYRDALLSAALTWLVLNHSDDRSFAAWISHASSWILADVLPVELLEDLNLLREKCEKMQPGSPEKIATRHALHLIDEWLGGMDAKTRANVRAVCHLVISSLTIPAALRLFRASPFRKFRVKRVIEDGRIYVVTLNAFLLSPSLAQLVARVCKAEYYTAALNREPGGRLVVLFADEFQLAATSSGTATRYEDTLALATMRSRNSCVCAATQSLAGLDRAVGNLSRRVLLGNFGSVFFLRSTEPEIESWAQQVCGSVEAVVTETESVKDSRSAGGLADGYQRTLTRRVMRPVCGPGALARLQTGQAYVMQEGVPSSPHPIWIAEGPA